MNNEKMEEVGGEISAGERMLFEVIEEYPHDDITMDSSVTKRKERANPVLLERMNEQRNIAEGALEDPKGQDSGEGGENRYMILVLGGVLGFLLVLALKHNAFLRDILKRFVFN